jgi:hypothetical protein
MKYPQSVNKSIFIHETLIDYIVDTMILEKRYDELHTIWCKGKDPNKKDT